MPTKATIEAAVADLDIEGSHCHGRAYPRGPTGGSPETYLDKNIASIRMPECPTSGTIPSSACPRCSRPPKRARPDIFSHIRARRWRGSTPTGNGRTVPTAWRISGTPRPRSSSIRRAGRGGDSLEAVHECGESSSGPVGEPRRLDRKIWQRVVVQRIGLISPQERAAYERETWGKLAQQRRDAEALDRARRLQ